jgi:hypothetical protein
MKLYLNNVKLPVQKCKRPKFTNVKGATWDHGMCTIDGEEYKLYLDTTWGEYVYFQYDVFWYKIKMFSTTVMDLKGIQYDIDPFDNVKLTTSI